jgi:hypothetical protein
VLPQLRLAAAAAVRLPGGPLLPEPRLPCGELGGAGACGPHSYESGLTVRTHLQGAHNSDACGGTSGSGGSNASGASGASLPLVLQTPPGPLQAAALPLQPQLPQQQQQPAPLVLDLRGPSHRSGAFSRDFSAAAAPACPPPAAAPAPPQPQPQPRAAFAPEAAAQSGGGDTAMIVSALLASLVSAAGAGAGGAPTAGV